MAEAAVKIRLKVDAETERKLDGQSRLCNALYNRLLEQANQLRRQYIDTQDPDIGKMLYTERGLRNLVPGMKDDIPALKTVHSSPLKNAALRLSGSIRNRQDAQHGRRKGDVVGWPRFRPWKQRWFSLFYDEPNKGFRLDGETLTLRFGKNEHQKRLWVTVRAPGIRRALKHKAVRNLRIVKQQGVFYAVFGVRRAVPDTKPVRRAVALDPNHKNLAYGIDTEGRTVEIETPWWLKRLDRRVDELKSRRDRCLRKSVKVALLDRHGNDTGRFYWRPSKQWQRYEAALKKALAKRREQTKTYLATVAQRLCRHYDLVAVGDYTPQGGGLSSGMRRAMNNQSVIARFKETLSWTALKSGKSYTEFEEAGTTRTCSNCGHVVSGGIDPDKRTWTCSDCGVSHIRDENAARNGLHRILQDHPLQNDGPEPSVPGSGPVPIRERWTWRVRPSGIHSRGGRAAA